jgi:competence protein ComEC
MNNEAPEARALRPLWSMTTGAVIGAAGAALTGVAGPSWWRFLLLGLGGLCAILALRRGRESPVVWWLLAGFALVAARGLGATADRLDFERNFSDGETTVRARVVINEGWTEGRWGHRTRVRVVEAGLGGHKLRFPPRCRFEVRGDANPLALPSPGVVVDTLVRVRGSPQSPLLVVSSARLLSDTGDRSGLPRLRQWLADSLLSSAGTSARSIRAAELAAALSLGRRDLVPAQRRDRWRASGLAHLLAVSGLHVGLVGGAVWLLVPLFGASPRATRFAVLITLPAYAMLAGAAPSAVRAAMMGVIYLGARLLGRAILPMAAVLLAALILLLAQPTLITDIGFQLTVVITAALVRWVPAVADVLPAPRWLGGALAVPLVAQGAAAPLISWHFRSLIPGAIVANILALPLLGPTILASVGAAVIAPIWKAGASSLLALVSALTAVLQLGGRPARAFELVTPPMPIAAAVALVAAGWLGLQAGRRARWGAAGWFFVLVVFGISFVWPVSGPVAVELLPVSDGAAVMLRDGRDTVLVDAGRYRDEAARLLADARRRKLAAVVASHTDEDHVGGIGRVIRTLRVDRLLLPVWMLTEPESVPLLRAARRRGTSVEGLARGSATGIGWLRLEVLWPPARHPPERENERSLVTRAVFRNGVVLLTADIGRRTEVAVSRVGFLGCDVLVVPHHGSRHSSSRLLLASASPRIALIPAAPGNNHGHPHEEVLKKLADRGIDHRYPARDGRCGARWNGERWEAYP